MKLGKNTCWTLLCGLPLLIAGCSGGGGGASGTINSAVQNLTQDPDGTTTVITFSQAPGAFTAANFSSSGGQTPLSATGSGNTATVTWSDRVTPSHTITVSGIGGISDQVASVTTSNSAAPTFAITGSSQVAGLGGDTLQVTFSGPRVVEADAEDPSNWTLDISGTSVDLTGSTFALDPNTGVMDITLGASAGLHASYTLAASTLTSVADVALSTTPVAGTASGDAVAPLLTSVAQNLAQDEFGRTIDLTFDEAMDPTFSEVVSNFTVGGGIIATSVAQPSAGLLRVTFSAPVIPGVNTITLANMMDAHGNAGPAGAQAVTQPSPAVNAYSTHSAVTVANQGGDHLLATFAQAFDATSAGDDTNWTLLVDGNPVTMANQTLTYNFSGKSLRIDLDFDMVNGTSYALTGVGVLEVDGQTFSLVANGTVGGDTTPPTVTSVLQNRVQDPSGQTLDVTFSEDIDATAISTLTNWTVAGLTVSAANQLGTPDVVRLTLTGGAAVPGTHTLDVANQADLAGTAMAAPQTGIAITSTDSSAPSVTSVSVNALAGAENDTVVVTFDDDMVQSEVETATNWTVESPVGTSLSTAGTTISFDGTARRATLTFDAGSGIHFKGGDDFLVSLATMTDISDNALAANSTTGNVSYETDRPSAHGAYAEASINTEIVVYFSEHMDYLDDLYDASTNVDGTRYVVRDSGGVLKGLPLSATVLDGGLGVRLAYGFVINASDTLDVIGATDLVGNYMFPSLLMPLSVESASEPALSLPGTPLVAVSGERNDTIQVVFDRRMNPWGVTDHTNYDISTGGNSLDLSTATFSFDGNATVDITLDGALPQSLQAASAYDFSVTGLRSDQGVLMTAASTSLGETVTGDITTGPVVGPTGIFVDRANADSLLVFADEALDPTLAEDESRWNWNSGNIPTLATLIGPSTVRLTFATNTSASTPLAYDVVDLAGNNGGATFHTVQAFEATPPVLVSTGGTAVAGAGGDYITVVFNEPTDTSTSLNAANFTVTMTPSGTPLAITGVGAWYDSTNLSANFYLAAGNEFDASQGVDITVSNVSDHSGNIMPTPVTLGGAVGGDTSTPPGVTSAFTNFRVDPTGLLVDVLFDEAPEETFITNQFNWTVTGGGGQVVLGVLPTADETVYRVVLSGALGAGEELEIATGMTDLAGNATVAATTVTVTE